MLSWRRGAGSICLPTPSIYISLSFPSHLWLVVAVAVFAERNQRRSEPLSRSTAIRNANVSHLPHSRVAVALAWFGPLIPTEVEVREDLQQQRAYLFIHKAAFCIKNLFHHFPNGPGVMAALSTQAWPWAGLGPHVPA